MPSVESIKLMTIIEAKIGTKRKKVKLQNFLLNYMHYRYSDESIIYKDHNRIKGSFDYESL